MNARPTRRRLGAALCAVLVCAPLPTLAGAQAPPDEAMRVALRQTIAESSSFKDRFDAEVWLLDMSRRLQSRLPDAEARLRLLKLVHLEASRAELPPELVLAVIEGESNFDRYAISHAGARGLMQVMPFWIDEIGKPGDNLFQVRTNLRFGCAILRYYLDREDGNMQRALARYNGSVGKYWYPDRVYKALSQRWYRQ